MTATLIDERTLDSPFRLRGRALASYLDGARTGILRYSRSVIGNGGEFRLVNRWMDHCRAHAIPEVVLRDAGVRTRLSYHAVGTLADAGVRELRRLFIAARAAYAPIERPSPCNGYLWCAPDEAMLLALQVRDICEEHSQGEEITR